MYVPVALYKILTALTFREYMLCAIDYVRLRLSYRIATRIYLSRVGSILWMLAHRINTNLYSLLAHKMCMFLYASTTYTKHTRSSIPLETQYPEWITA